MGRKKKIIEEVELSQADLEAEQEHLLNEEETDDDE